MDRGGEKGIWSWMLYRRSPAEGKVGKVQGSPTNTYEATAKSVAFISTRRRALVLFTERSRFRRKGQSVQSVRTTVDGKNGIQETPGSTPHCSMPFGPSDPETAPLERGGHRREGQWGRTRRVSNDALWSRGEEPGPGYQRWRGASRCGRTQGDGKGGRWDRLVYCL